MSRFRWPVVVLLICAPVALLATGVPLPLLDAPAGRPRPAGVPAGDHELAYLHTTTNGTTWERFVAGMLRATALLPGLEVDAGAAFSDQTTAVPEVVLSVPGRPGRLRVRWYKLSSEQTTADWVRALAGREPPPLALVGGGSSDRAADLARAMADQKTWRGPPPLLFVTTATADEVGDADRRPLIDVYPGRTFRFCFTNRQMADAVTDFVWGRPDLRPGLLAADDRAAAGGGLLATAPPAGKPHAFGPVWEDDPFSQDLHRCFREAVGPRAVFTTHPIAFSVGTFSRPNRDEGRAADDILAEAAALPPQRSLLVLSTITQPARRLLRALAESSPQLARRLVAVSGDGVPVNALYRDGEFAWPVHALPVPLVLFTHHDPTDWNSNPPGCAFPLEPPNSTEDVLHFAELTRAVSAAAYAPDPAPLAPDALAGRLRALDPPLFDPAGNRRGGRGEYVCVLRPQVEAGNAGELALPRAELEVWQRAGGGWRHVRTNRIEQRGLKAFAQAGRGGRG